MVSLKVVIGLKDGTCVQKELAEEYSKELLGKSIGDEVSGDAIGFAGYSFHVTGGSDYCGFPMRKDIPGATRKRILAVSGIGIHKKAKGIRQRKTVCGAMIHPKTAQVNMKITKEGKEPLKAAPKEEKAEAAAQ